MDNIVLYDGECGFCNFWVQWILKHDSERRFRFAPLQGEFGQQFLSSNRLSTTVFDTVYFIKSDKYYSKLGAIAEIGNTLGGAYSLLMAAKFLPDFIADGIYGAVSRNRKKIAGESCMLITAEQKKQFMK